MPAIINLIVYFLAGIDLSIGVKAGNLGGCFANLFVLVRVSDYFIGRWLLKVIGLVKA